MILTRDIVNMSLNTNEEIWQMIIDSAPIKLSGDGKYSLYIHIAPDKRVYVGITTNIWYRWKDNGAGYNHGRFKDAIRTIGWNNFEHHVIKDKLTEEEADLLEQLFIAYYKATNVRYGFNKSSGGMARDKYKNKKVICLNTGMIYDSIYMAERKTKKLSTLILLNCNGDTKFVEDIKQNKTHWMFYDDYIESTTQQNNKREVTNMDEVKILDIFDGNGNKIDYALVDSKTYIECKNYRWFKDEDGYYYALINNQQIYLCYMVLKVEDGQIIKYRTDDIRDNRLDNLIAETNEDLSEIKEKSYNKGYTDGYRDALEVNVSKLKKAQNEYYTKGYNDALKKIESILKDNVLEYQPSKIESTPTNYTILKEYPNEIWIYDNCIEILIPYRNEIVKVKTNIHLLDTVKKYKWNFSESTGAYTTKYIKNKTVSLHRLIYGIVNDTNWVTKFKDEDKSNCMKENIQLYTREEYNNKIKK